MNYFKDENNKIFAFDDTQVIQGYAEGLTILEKPIWNGKVLVGHKKISKVQKKEDGSYATYYNEDETIDVVKEEAEAKVTALSNANTEYEMQVKALTEGVPESEKLTWTKQELEARGYLADNTHTTPLLDGIVSTRGIDKDYLVNKVIEKADLYAQTIGNLTGLRQSIEDKIVGN